ncbi:colicin-like pore-forming protein [Yersinia ruckeri]|uniref:colicin-like pore-forming protein n=1 Tax=Yersinia ruckeri TaxID=29486 RepID=UPI003D0D27D4
MSHSYWDTHPPITITGGPEKLPNNPSPNGGIYVPQPQPGRESYGGWGGVQVAYKPGGFTPYNSIVALETQSDNQIANAKKSQPGPIQQTKTNAVTACNNANSVVYDPRVSNLVNTLKYTLQALSEVEVECNIAQNDLTTKTQIAKKALSDSLPKLGLTKVDPRDYDVIFNVLQPVARKYWELNVVKQHVDEINAKQLLYSKLNKLNVAQSDVNNKTKLLNDVVYIVKEENNIKDAVKFTANFYQTVTEKYGEQSAKIARELADAAKGKQIRSVDEALKAFDKYKDVLNKKFSVKDREAIAKALKSVDRKLMAKNLAKFSKAFGLVGKAVDGVDVVKEINNGMDTGDWRPLLIKLETLYSLS